MTQDELFGEFRTCEAVLPGGPCRAEGRVQIISRDFCFKVSERFSFCFDCAREAIADGIFKEADI